MRRTLSKRFPRGGRVAALPEVPELSVAELRELSEVDRLAYFLRSVKTDPGGTFLLALQYDQAAHSLTNSGSYAVWLLKQEEGLSAAHMREALEKSDLRGWERAAMEGWIARLDLVRGTPEERIEKLMDGAQWSTYGDIMSPLSRLAESDPAQALSYFERTVRERPEAVSWGLSHDVLVRLASENPAAFEALYRGTEQESLRHSLGNALATVLGERDVSAGLAMLDAMPLSSRRTQATIHFVQGWGGGAIPRRQSPGRNGN